MLTQLSADAVWGKDVGLEQAFSFITNSYKISALIWTNLCDYKLQNKFKKNSAYVQHVLKEIRYSDQIYVLNQAVDM